VKSSPGTRSHRLPLLLNALAATTVLGLVGCAELDASEPTADTVARSEGPLTATPGTASFGRVLVGSETDLGLELDNVGRTELIIGQVSIIPPDPYDPAYVPPDPCVPPDPYHNPPGFLTTRLIAPCVRPGDATKLALAFAPTEAGGFAAGVQIDYATSDGVAYTLTVPATACAVTR
jgi:hypothetical protein